MILILIGLLLTGLIVVSLTVYSFYFHFYRNYPLANNSNRVNLLFLGKGGANHEAPDLTDTIILTSINLATNQVKVVSLPRDLWDDRLQAKLNSAYYWGRQSQTGGLSLVKKEVNFLTGVPIDYAIIIDFNLFKQVVNDLGGVKVNVATPFDDYLYPIVGREKALPIASRYKHVHFDAGWQTMNGDRALEFVRSRHAQGDEGSDFARSRRQQLLIKSVINQLLNDKTYWLTHPSRAWFLINKWWSSLEADLSLSDVIYLMARLGVNQLKRQPLAINSLTFNLESPQLVPAKEEINGVEIWVLKPNADKLRQAVQAFVAN